MSDLFRHITYWNNASGLKPGCILGFKPVPVTNYIYNSFLFFPNVVAEGRLTPSLTEADKMTYLWERLPWVTQPLSTHHATLAIWELTMSLMSIIQCLIMSLVSFSRGLTRSVMSFLRCRNSECCHSNKLFYPGFTSRQLFYPNRGRGDKVIDHPGHQSFRAGHSGLDVTRVRVDAVNTLSWLQLTCWFKSCCTRITVVNIMEGKPVEVCLTHWKDQRLLD